jgi:hypothetical protein
VNRKELERRIWGKTIASARRNGLISEQEANFLLDEYLKECKAKIDWSSQNFGNLFGSSGKSSGGAVGPALYR